MLELNCIVCESTKDVKHLPIYAFGSEGVCLCNGCRIALAEYIRLMRRINGNLKLKIYKSKKEV